MQNPLKLVRKEEITSFCFKVISRSDTWLMPFVISNMLEIIIVTFLLKFDLLSKVTKLDDIKLKITIKPKISARVLNVFKILVVSNSNDSLLWLSFFCFKLFISHLILLLELFLFDIIIPTIIEVR